MYNDYLEQKGQLSVDYLVRKIFPNGSFDYVVYLTPQLVIPTYNILRHAGALYELCRWVKRDSREDHFSKLNKSFDFLVKQIQPWNEHLCIVENNLAKLGGSALALIALIEYWNLKKDTSLLATMEGLASFIVSCQESNGKFNSKYVYDSQRLTSFQSEYYSGQAILALVEYSILTNNDYWLNNAKAGANFLLLKEIVVTPNSNAIDTWYAKSLGRLLNLSYNPQYSAKLCEIVAANLKSLSDFRIFNVHKKSFNAASMASLGEALYAGIEILSRDKKFDIIYKIKDALNYVISFCLKLQVTNNESTSGSNCVGGIIQSQHNRFIRIDFVQHVLSVINSILANENIYPSSNDLIASKEKYFNL